MEIQKMTISDTNFDNEVIYYINENGKIRREELIVALMKAHTKTNENGHTTIDTGYSKPTINRCLNRMVNSGKILSLDYKELNKYGFEETDKRAKYLFTPEGLKLKTHIDNVLKLLKTGDETDKQMALKELNRYEKLYSFDESQLDLLVENLKSVNPELINKFLVTLEINIVKKGKELQNKEALLQALRSILDKYGAPKGYSGHIRNCAMSLLCHYKDEYIIDQLIKDATTLPNPQEVEHDYDLSSIAEIIVNNPSRLFEIEKQLMKEGKHSSVDFISNIRSTSMVLLGMSNVSLRNNNIEGAEF